MDSLPNRCFSAPTQIIRIFDVWVVPSSIATHAPFSFQPIGDIPIMNKLSCTAVALAAFACAGLAHAQSSVTIYGVADVSLAKTTGKSVQLAGASPLTNGSSRLGFRGKEDLGGGMSAQFNLEAQVSLDTGAAADAFFGRAANVTLAGGFGSLLLGRTLTPSFRAVSAWELMGAANYNPVSSQFNYVGVNSRNNAEIAYTTPDMGGFTATLAHVLKGNNADEVSKSEIALIYKGGPVVTSMAYNKLSNKDANYMVGGSYDFGVAKLAASYQDATGGGKGKGFTLGGSVKAGPVLLTLEAARDTEKKDTDMILEAKYPLSKRTFLYGAYAHNGKGKAATDLNSTMFGMRHNF
jgi:predicted porin